jgi:hypothetical protein
VEKDRAKLQRDYRKMTVPCLIPMQRLDLGINENANGCLAIRILVRFFVGIIGLLKRKLGLHNANIRKNVFHKLCIASFEVLQK